MRAPENPQAVFERVGGVKLKLAVTILTERQAERLFREAVKAAETSRKLGLAAAERHHLRGAARDQFADETLEKGGADRLHEGLAVLTEQQATKLFRDAYRAAVTARNMASDDLAAWHDRNWSGIRRPSDEGFARSTSDWANGRRKSPPAAPRFDGAPHEVLGVCRFASAAEIKAAWRGLTQVNHPDRGGSTAAQAAINAARDAMLKVAA